METIRRLLAIAAEKPLLEDLSLPALSVNWLRNLSTITETSATEKPLFGKLKFLDITASNKELEQIAPFVTTIQRLQIFAKGSETNKFSMSPLTQLPKLRELLVKIPYPGIIVPSSSLIALALSNHNLTIIRFHNGCSKMNNFDDAFVEEFTANLPLLTELSLDFKVSKATVNSLIAVGVNCPQLTLCCLPLSGHAAQPREEANKVCWPNLESLWVTSNIGLWVTPNTSHTLAPNISIYVTKQRMPKLVEFNTPRGMAEGETLPKGWL